MCPGWRTKGGRRKGARRAKGRGAQKGAARKRALKGAKRRKKGRLLASSVKLYQAGAPSLLHTSRWYRVWLPSSLPDARYALSATAARLEGAHALRTALRTSAGGAVWSMASQSSPPAKVAARKRVQRAPAAGQSTAKRSICSGVPAAGVHPAARGRGFGAQGAGRASALRCAGGWRALGGG